MLGEIKKQLINHPDSLVGVLEHFGYCNIVNHGKYISCGRDEESSKKSIVVRLENNDYLYMTDYARNINKDIFSFIIKQRHVEFIDVLTEVKNALGLTDYNQLFEQRGIFGGFYDGIKKNTTYTVRTYDDSILDQYDDCGNARFLADHISLQAQKFFGIRYDVASQGIVIPIRDQIGQLMGVKERFNYDVDDRELKYFYEIPCAMSHTLYGYSQNYEYLVENDVLIFESEKSVMQCYSYGIRNCVALGSGSISTKQVKMLLELRPKNVIFLHDIGYELDRIMRNIDKIMGFSRFSQFGCGYWDYFGKGYTGKSSPSDLGEEKFEDILQHEIKMIGDDEEDEL